MYLKKDHINRIIILILAITNSCLKSNGLDESFSIDKIEPFKLKGVNMRIYENKDLLGQKGTVLIFLSNHCKVSQLFQKSIILNNENWSNNGIKLTVISPNFEEAILPDELAYTEAGDSFIEMRERAENQDYNFPFLYDGAKQIITKSLSVKITPSAFLFNKHGKLTYCGRIGNHEKPNETKDLEINKAIERILNDDYTYKRTKVYGTSIKFEKDLDLAERVRKRYSQETIYLNYCNKRKLDFFLKQQTNYPRFFYVWTPFDNQTQTRENLISISTNYKIFRKRGLKVYTICICPEQEKDIALEILKIAQLSTLNFYISATNITELSKLRAPTGLKTTPFCRLLYGNGKMDYGTNGLINHKSLRKSLLKVLKRD